ncbi:hypothetical protein H2203_001316 [Taxawa tesnikishii (nom. ined.)]|nr:hypothetical protein H2203_001316 [Dothideales sp. JES 119]
MFFEGDLQTGISKAIQEQKLVACFVRQDDDHWSRVWEEEWLSQPLKGEQRNESDATLGDLLAEKAVILRINASSQEAGFLSAFCSLNEIPKLVVIKYGRNLAFNDITNGVVLEDITGGVSEEEFVRRVSSCAGFSEATSTTQGTTEASPGSPPSVPPESVPGASQAQPSESTVTPSQPAQPEAGTAPPAAAAPPPDTSVQEMLSERATRLEADRQKREQAEKEARRAVAKARREAADKETAESSSAPQARPSWIEEQRNRQKEARLERERILKPSRATKLHGASAEAQAGASSSEAGPSKQASLDKFAPQAQGSVPPSAHKSCNLQIRLFDGTSLRRRFASSSTLATAVRTYIAEESNTDIPYSFRQILTPAPSRTIEISEENETLQSLGLTPSATLVLVPVKGYTEAYQTGGVTGMVQRRVNMGHGMVFGAVGYVVNTLGSFLGYGAPGAPQAEDGPYVAGTGDEIEPSNVKGGKMAEERPQTASSAVRVRTLADQRRDAGKEGNELYNGNQLNFEPRKKDEEDKE